MTSSEITQARIAFKILINDKERMIELISKSKLQVHSSCKFVILLYLTNKLDDIDTSLYSESVLIAIDLLRKVQQEEENKPIHGDFYPDLRQRYFELLNTEPLENSDTPFDESHLAWMLTELSKSTMSETKKHRWLGYVQGIMAMKSYINVNKERDYTRDMFSGK